MKKLLLRVSLFFVVQIASAQTPELPPVPSEAERTEQREHLARQRQRLEDQYKQDMTLCYQNFDVTSCRLKARERRIEANNLLRKDELRFNASERLIQTEDAKRSMAERTSEAARKEAETARMAAIAASKERADVNAQKQIEHSLQGSKRGDFEQKQREAAERRADVERKLRERNKEPAAPLPVPSR
jgi:colicin import membrane protein